MEGVIFAAFLPLTALLWFVFINRYVVGFSLAHGLRQKQPPMPESLPTVDIVTPMFNEGAGICTTIASLLAMDYPPELLRVVVVDDASTDDSYAHACNAQNACPQRVTVLKNPRNMGKRRSINQAVRQSSADFILSVDSDVVVDPQAVRELVRGFDNPRIAAVGGRVWVANANQNWLTRMQAIKYFLGYQYAKNLENAFGAVLCLSGCLTAYRRSVLMELEPILETRALFGVPITYGEDRFLTRQILNAGHQTRLTRTAMCWTVAPHRLANYFSQQLRWRRSNIVDFLVGAKSVWRLPPCVAAHYVSLFGLLMGYPLILAQSIENHDLPWLMMVHSALLVVLGMVYAWEVRHMGHEQRVHPFWLVSLAVIMPVTYLLHTVLALFTLDSSSWETRGHVAVQETLVNARPELVQSLDCTRL